MFAIIWIENQFAFGGAGEKSAFDENGGTTLFAQDGHEARATHATIAATGCSEVWVTHGQEDALVHWSKSRGLKARPLDIVGYGDEDEHEPAVETA